MCKYSNWIIEYNRRVGNVYGKCEQATLEMQQTFPKLIRKRGHVEVPFQTKNPEHWWLETTDGIIVDPTELQFSCVIRYIELDESLPEPIGKCINCGEYVFPGAINDHACSIECNDAIIKSFDVIQ